MSISIRLCFVLLGAGAQTSHHHPNHKPGPAAAASHCNHSCHRHSGATAASRLHHPATTGSGTTRSSGGHSAGQSAVGAADPGDHRPAERTEQGLALHHEATQQP